MTGLRASAAPSRSGRDSAAVRWRGRSWPLRCRPQRGPRIGGEVQLQGLSSGGFGVVAHAETDVGGADAEGLVGGRETQFTAGSILQFVVGVELSGLVSGAQRRLGRARPRPASTTREPP